MQRQRETEEEEAEKGREIRSVLDAYHQRELKSCNSSKKHPWAEKSRRWWGLGATESKTYA